MNLAFRPFAAGGPYVRMALRRAPIRPSDICRMDALRSIDENLAVFRKPKVQDVMGLKDALRNFMGIRLERALPPPGTMPPLGSNIALGKLRMRLRYPIDNRQWQWLCQKGWRTIDMRTDRRNYYCLPDEVVARLMASEGTLRDDLYEKILDLYGEPGTAKTAVPVV